jgi:hypothetical protein
MRQYCVFIDFRHGEVHGPLRDVLQGPASRRAAFGEELDGVGFASAAAELSASDALTAKARLSKRDLNLRVKPGDFLYVSVSLRCVVSNYS